MFLAKTLSFYKRKDIQEEIVKQAKDKEVAFRFGDFFGKRPETLTYPNDVMELAKQKLTSLHCSEELWNSPLQLRTDMRKEEQDALRKGWDLILDIDCKLFEYSKIAAYYTIKALKHNNVKSITAKFSGNKGFHIAVPFEAFPESIDGVPVKNMFPDAPRRIAEYITFLIREPLAKALQKVEKNNFNNIVKRTGLKSSQIIRYEKNEFGDKIPKLNVDPFLEIDTLLISSRHLYRMPYSFHEKSELVSVPVDINNILKFKKEDAEPDKVKIKHAFLDREVISGDAANLLKNAFDFKPSSVSFEEEEEIKKKFDDNQKTYALPEKAIGEENFPPCIKLILNGLEDGRKRSVFVLINFLASCGWDYEMIEKRLFEWNEKNHEPLRQQYILGQLRYAKQGKKVMPPPNCDNLGYYKGLTVCKPEDLCNQIKNPLQYAKRKDKAYQRKPKPVKKTKKE
ncbi:MAG: hypothetical protein KKF46_02110 [Nanoarchaeota archaeon]|nr:hypothetical protein [Nanoarchaeota archaeon]MBU1321128.1 hypothetical protein [Nanoarchaeota archaeon]MBU1597959.1 hypothetical protein [Nanoarchaeota archaeon]MBU2441804.1 hypothetical protein [Nanoarchaeota archaeon]